MGTIPTVAAIIGGEFPSSAKLNQARTAIAFWSNVPRCAAYLAAAQELASGTWATAVALGAEDVDVVQSGDSPMHDNATNPSRIYIRTAGRYEVSGQVTFDTASGSTRRVRLRLNAAGNGNAGTALLETTQDPVSGYVTAVAIPPIEYTFAVGDYVEVFGYQVTGSSVDYMPGYGVTFLRVKLVSP